MIAYFAAMPTLFFPIISHKMGMNHKEEAVLFVQRGLYDSRGLGYLIDELIKQDIFVDVIACSILCPKDLPLDASDDIAEKKITNYYDGLFRKYGYQIDKFEKIYVCNDTNWGDDINIYLNLKKIRYTWIEIIRNRTNENQISHSTNRKWVSLCSKYKSLTPFAEYADACVLFDSDISMKKLEKKGYTTWNCKDCFNNICQDDLERLFTCFHLSEMELKNMDNKGNVLLIKNSYGNLSNFIINSKYVKNVVGLRDYELKEIYSVMDKVSLDFYAHDASLIYLKCHIHDMLDSEKVAQLYGDKVKVFPNVPFEILVRYLQSENIKFDTIIGVISSSLDVVNEENCNHCICLGADFARTWWFYISLYVAIIFARQQNIKQILSNSVLQTQVKLISEQMNYPVEVNDYRKVNIQDIRDSLLIVDMCTESEKEVLKNIHSSNIVILLNADVSGRFFEVDDCELFVPLRIRKKCLSDLECDILCREEIVWIYSKDKKIRRDARNFILYRSFQNLQLEVFVKKISLSESIDLFQSNKIINENLTLRNKLEVISQKLENLSQFIAVDLDNPLSLSKHIKNITDIRQYFDVLKIIKSKYLIVMSVRDTPGNNLSDDTIQSIHEIGFTEFNKELWWMYIGIINNSDVIYDKKGGSREEPVRCKLDDSLLGLNISVSSMAWKQGNKAEIIINGVDYSVNIRGINLVVYEVENKFVIDSIGFDAHTSNWRFVRK